MIYKLLIRILLSPFIFIYGLYILIVLSLSIVLPIIMIHGICCIIWSIMVFVLKKGGTKIDYPEPLLDFLLPSNSGDNIKTIITGHFLSSTVYIWLPFLVTYCYLKNGDIVNLF